ncbi:MAG: rod shape-determining protein MreC [Puniceicoccales bacterium]|jgi:hypothetical protein|nr:rod shape-determining protein MreC [Puniceicoccales bacterium]
MLGWWLLPAAFCLRSEKILRSVATPIYGAIDRASCTAAHWSLLAQPKEWMERKIVELSRELAMERLKNGVAAAADFPDAERYAIPACGELGGFRTAYGRVLRRNVTAWWSELVLAVGDAGAEEGCMVLCGDHLAGKVLSAAGGRAVAILLTDPRFRAIAHRFGDSRPLVYEGVAQRGFGPPVGRISCVPMDLAASDECPLSIVTSSLSGACPDGIAIGTVRLLRPSGDGVFQEGEVLLCDRLLSLREVALLIAPSAAAETTYPR